MQPGDVLDFWFDDVQSDSSRIAERTRFWFGDARESEAGRTARDLDISNRFAPYMQARRRGELDGWAGDAAGRLALILLVDQFPRSVHRGKPAAFADDPVARGLCRDGIQLGMDRRLVPIERIFFYLPLEHSEALVDQDQCVALMSALQATAPPELEPTFAGFARYARSHRDIVARFGRFPHRNRILGREDTPEEKAYLAADAPGFGQH